MLHACHDELDDGRRPRRQGGNEEWLHVTIELLNGNYRQHGAVTIAAC